MPLIRHAYFANDAWHGIPFDLSIVLGRAMSWDVVSYKSFARFLQFIVSKTAAKSARKAYL